MAHMTDGMGNPIRVYFVRLEGPRGPRGGRGRMVSCVAMAVTPDGAISRARCANDMILPTEGTLLSVEEIHPDVVKRVY